MATSPNERRQLLSELSTLAIRDLVTVWERAKVADVAFAAFLVDAFPEIATTYALVAADLAADWYQSSAPALPYRAVVAPTPPVEALTRSARWALGADGDEALSRMSGTMQRAVYDGARGTILLNVESEGSRWARHASANACEFCKLLATRTEDSLYTSRESALRVVGRGKDFSTNFRADGTRKAGGQAQGVKARGPRKVGEKYHDFCHCVAVEVRAGQSYTPPPYVEQWQQDYQTAWDAVPDGTSYADNGVLRAVLAQWRQIDNAT